MNNISEVYKQVEQFWEDFRQDPVVQDLDRQISELEQLTGLNIRDHLYIEIGHTVTGPK